VKNLEVPLTDLTNKTL